MTKILDIEEIIERELHQLHFPSKPMKEQKIGNQLLVAGVPIVPSSKVEQLKKFVKNKMDCEDVYIPMESNDQSQGFMFVKFENDEKASLAHQKFNGAAFDKSHIYKTIPLNEFYKLMKEDVEWKEPAPLDFKYKEDMYSWCEQIQCRDQLLVHNRSDVNVYEHSQKNLEQKWSKSDFPDSIVTWSPLGTYMATIHGKGVALWGGKDFGQINKFPHADVKHILFSPNEKYVMTFSKNISSNFVNVLDVLTGLLIREFVIPKSDEEDNQKWPDFRWSCDDVFFARKQKDKLSIYQSDTCIMIDKKSIEIIGIKDFTWSAKGHLISYWVGEQESSPARIVLLSVPSKKEVFAKTLFNVADISLKWSSQDDFLAVIGERYVKKKLIDNQFKYIGSSASLEIYRIKEKEIPVEKIAIGDKAQILAHDWEANGSKFAILTTKDKPNVTNIQIYDLKVVDPQQKKLMDYSFNSQMKLLKWSPSGQFIACSAENSSVIEFIDGYEGSVLRRVETHPLEDFMWDPTGRYLLSYRLSTLSDTTECSVTFHTITGRLLMEKSFLGLRQIMWRPRPPCLLTDVEIKNIKKNMSKYNTKFAHQDEMMSNETKRKLLEGRQKQWQEWDILRKRIQSIYNSEKDIRMAKRKNIDTDNLEHGKCKEQTYVLVSSRVEQLSR